MYLKLTVNLLWGTFNPCPPANLASAWPTASLHHPTITPPLTTSTCGLDEQACPCIVCASNKTGRCRKVNSGTESACW